MRLYEEQRVRTKARMTRAQGIQHVRVWHQSVFGETIRNPGEIGFHQ